MSNIADLRYYERMVGMEAEPDEIPEPTEEEMYYNQLVGATDVALGPTSTVGAKYLQAQHMEMIRLKILGFNYAEIARRLEMSPSTISTVLNSELARKHMARLQGTKDEQVVHMEEELRALIPRAVGIYSKILGGEYDVDVMDMKKVADEVLDRTGFGKTVKRINQNTNVQLTKSDLDELRKSVDDEIKNIVDISAYDTKEGGEDAGRV